MIVPRRAAVRFGTLRIALALGHERYARAFETHLRSILDPPLDAGELADLSIEVLDDSATSPAAGRLERDHGQAGQAR